MSNLLTDNINRIWTSIIVDELTKYGINQFFISPGLRNAPLISAIENHCEANLINGIDERSQAYKALGYSKASQTPCVLVCTSGTAIANYLPAIIEASKTNVSLIILSADRPFELIESNANQTIHQEKVINGYTDSFLDIECPNEGFCTNKLRKLIGINAIKTKYSKNILHINLHLREPLDHQKDETSEKYIKKAIQEEVSSAPILLNDFNIEKTSYKNPLIVFGELDKAESDQLKPLIKKIKTPFYCDVTSGLKYLSGFNQGHIPTFDHPEVYQYFKANPPDAIFYFGSRLTGKKFYRLLENINTDFYLFSDFTKSFSYPPSGIDFLGTQEKHYYLSTILKKYNTQYLENQNWHSFIQKKTDIIDNFEHLTTPKISKTLIENSNDKSVFFIGNSTAIRSFDSYTALEIQKDFEVYTNRGASGIEGLLSTAIGVSLTGKTVNLIIGDISLLHDFNALFSSIDTKINLNIFVLNNKSGGIFDLLNVRNDELTKKHIQTHHELNFVKLLENNNFSYNVLSIDKPEDLSSIQIDLGEGLNFIECNLSNQHNKAIYDVLNTIKL